MVSKNPVFRAIFDDRDILDCDDQETAMRDKLTREWWETLVQVCPTNEGWKHFVPEYSEPVPLETVAFERWHSLGRLELHPFLPFVYRIA